MISMHLILQLVIGALIAVVCWWGLDKIGLPEPFNKIIRVLLVVVIVIWLCNILLALSGNGPLIRY